jgi:hypothetical protein
VTRDLDDVLSRIRLTQAGTWRYLTLAIATSRLRGHCLPWDENEPASRIGAVWAEGHCCDCPSSSRRILYLTLDERLDDTAAPAEHETEEPASHVSRMSILYRNWEAQEIFGQGIVAPARKGLIAEGRAISCATRNSIDVGARLRRSDQGTLGPE